MQLCFNLFIFAFTLSHIALAQNRIGNGGDIVICPHNKPIILDFYENQSNLIQNNSDDYKEIIKSRIALLEKANPKLSDQYKRRLLQIENEIEFKKNITLVDVKDSEHLFEPKDKKCKLNQIAIRKNNTIGNEKRFIIDEELWSKMDNINKAGLIMHEIIYEHFYNLGEKNSTKARKLNNYLFSLNFDKSNFWKLIQELKIPIYSN